MNNKGSVSIFCLVIICTLSVVFIASLKYISKVKQETDDIRKIKTAITSTLADYDSYIYYNYGVLAYSSKKMDIEDSFESLLLANDVLAFESCTVNPVDHLYDLDNGIVNTSNYKEQIIRISKYYSSATVIKEVQNQFNIIQKHIKQFSNLKSTLDDMSDITDLMDQLYNLLLEINQSYESFKTIHTEVEEIKHTLEKYHLLKNEVQELQQKNEKSHEHSNNSLSNKKVELKQLKDEVDDFIADYLSDIQQIIQVHDSSIRVCQKIKDLMQQLSNKSALLKSKKMFIESSIDSTDQFIEKAERVLRTNKQALENLSNNIEKRQSEINKQLELLIKIENIVTTIDLSSIKSVGNNKKEEAIHEGNSSFKGFKKTISDSILTDDLFNTKDQLPSQVFTHQKENTIKEFGVIKDFNTKEMITDLLIPQKKIGEKALISEYILGTYKSNVAYKHSLFKRDERDSAISGEIEYILNGDKNEKINHVKTVSKVYSLVSIVKLIAIYTDVDDISLIRSTAYAATGWFSGPIGGELLTFIIALSQAMVESVGAMKDLLDGQAIDITDNFLEAKGEELDVATDPVNIKMEYGDFLRILLIITPEEKLLTRSMDIIYSNVSKKYNESINCISTKYEFKVKYDDTFKVHIIQGY